MSKDLRDIERGVDSLAASPPDAWETDPRSGKSVPVPVRSVAYILELLPPRMRIVGLALILGAIIYFLTMESEILK